MDGTNIQGVLNQYKGSRYENNHRQEISYCYEQSIKYTFNIPWLLTTVLHAFF